MSTLVRRFGVGAVTGASLLVLAVGPALGSISLTPPTASQVGMFYTVAGTPSNPIPVAGNAGDGGQATGSGAKYGNLRDAVYAPDGSIYFTDSMYHVVRRISPTGVLSTVAGLGYAGRSGENVPALGSALVYPHGLLLTKDESKLLIAESGSGRIRAITLATGLISTYVGKTGSSLPDPTYSGDGGPAIGAGIAWPSAMSYTSNGSLLITDSTDNRIRKVTNPGTASAKIWTVAGNGQTGAVPGAVAIGDGGLATSAALNTPRDAIELPDHTILISEEEGNRIRQVSTSGIISTFAGGSAFPSLGVADGYGDGGPASAAIFFRPRELQLSPGKQSVFVGDRDNGSIRKISLTGTHTITTAVGVTGFRGWSGSNKAATSANMRLVFGFSITNGWLIVTDGNRAIHKIGITTTTA